MLLGQLWTVLLPVGSVAFRMSLFSALFAGLTAVTVKAGLAGVDPDFALLLRVVLVTVLLLPLVVMTGKWTNPASLPPRSLGFLALSAVATAPADGRPRSQGLPLRDVRHGPDRRSRLECRT